MIPGPSVYRINAICIFSLVLALTLAACSDDDNPATSGGSLTAPAPPAYQIIDCPAGLAASTDTYATYAENYLTYIGAITAFDSYITPAAGASLSATGTTPDTTKAAWTEGTLSYEVRYVVIAGVQKWFVYLDGVDGSSTFDNQLFIEAIMNADASIGGEFEAHPNPADFADILHWDWHTDSGEYTMVYDPSGANSYRATLAADNSGSVMYLVNDVNNIGITWVADGNSGTWTNYSGTIQSGIWTAP